MRLPDWHIHVSEREADGSWEDCTWDSGIEWLRVTQDKAIPATHKEAQALRADSGEPPTGGSNIGDLKRGIKARYGMSTPAAVSGFANLWDVLKPGTAGVIQGSMGAFGPLNPLSRWDRNFDGGHAVCVMRLDTQDRVWWCDPEAPKDVGYNGEWVTKDQLRKFVQAFSGQHLVDTIIVPAPVEMTTMPNLTKYLPGYTCDIKSGSNIRADAKIAATKFRQTSTVEHQTLIGTVKGDIDPANGSDVWYMWWANGHYEFTATDNVKNVTAPVTDCSLAVKTAVDAQKATDAVHETLAVAAAKVTERDRIADASATAESARIKAL